MRCFFRMARMQLLFLLLLHVIIGRVDAATSDSLIECRNGWVTFSNACYKFERVVYPWQDARSLCQSQSSNLLVIQREEEHQWVKSYIGKIHDRTHWWLGLKGLDQSGNWLTRTETTNYTVPFADEPDNSDGDKDCVTISNRGFLRNQACKQIQGFICRAYKPTAKNKCEKESGGWFTPAIQTTENCYWLSVLNRKSWPDAKAACRSLRLKGTNVTADLLSIQDKSEWSYLKSHLIKYQVFSGDLWTGLKYEAQSKKYTFSDNRPFVEGVMPWLTKTALGDIGDNCGATLKSGKEMAYPCERNLAYICKHTRVREEGKKCPDFWHTGGKSCYYTSQERDFNWTAAVSKCNSMKAHLLKTDSPEEKAWLEESTAALQFPRYWTGLNAREKKGVYVWEDGSRLDQSLLVWDTGLLEQNNCGMLIKSELHYQNCEAHMPLLGCEYKLPADDEPCAVGWSRNLNKCYYFGEAYVPSWQSVKTKCYDVLKKNKPSHAVDVHYITIENEAELKFVVGKVGDQKTWLGLNDLKDKKTWVWEDAPRLPNTLKPVNSAREPDPNNRCVTITKGGVYQSAKCSSKRAYVCEKKGKPGTAGPDTKHMSGTSVLLLFSLILLPYI